MAPNKSIIITKGTHLLVKIIIVHPVENTKIIIDKTIKDGLLASKINNAAQIPIASTKSKILS